MAKLKWVTGNHETQLPVRLDFFIPAGWIQFLAYAVLEGNVNRDWLIDQKLLKEGITLTLRRSQGAAIEWINARNAHSSVGGELP